MLIIDRSQLGRQNRAQLQSGELFECDIPAAYCRQDKPKWPCVSELQVVRHYTRLSQKNFSIDTHFYPLGSCTMKYNPRVCNTLAMLPEFLHRHPCTPVSLSQGILSCLYELQQMLAEMTGMSAVSLQPMAGAQGEFAGVAMIRAYHRSRNDLARDTILVPDAAHGTNPASAVMCGFKVREVPSGVNGDVSIDALRSTVDEHTAGIMLTNPSTLGVFDRNISQIADIVHRAGGMLYYDGANLNAILGKVKPADMGFDVVHINLHKTFSTPHGGGGPGAGPIAVNDALAPFLPVPVVGRHDGQFLWLEEADYPQSIGRLSAHMGNAGILLRAYIYARMLGRQGMARVSDYAVLNANYLLVELARLGYHPAYPQRRASHEFIISLRHEAKAYGVNAMDFAKRLLDLGFHAPTAYFPLLIAECLLIEPTETEAKQELDAFILAMAQILREAKTEPELLKNAPHQLPVKRLDDVKAARELNLGWQDRAE